MDDQTRAEQLFDKLGRTGAFILPDKAARVQLLLTAFAEIREECCKAVCNECRSGEIPATFRQYAELEGWVHRLKDTNYTCKAAAIRATAQLRKETDYHCNDGGRCAETRCMCECVGCHPAGAQ